MKLSKLILLLLILASCSKEDTPNLPGATDSETPADPTTENVRFGSVSTGYDLSQAFYYAEDNTTINSIRIIRDEDEVERVFTYVNNRIAKATDTWTNDVLNQSVYQSNFSYDSDNVLVQISSEESHNGNTITSLGYDEQGRIKSIEFITEKELLNYDTRRTFYTFDYDENANVERMTLTWETTLNGSPISDYSSEYVYEYDESINPFSMYDHPTILTFNPTHTRFWWGFINPFSKNNISSVKVFDTNLNELIESHQYQYQVNSDNLPVDRYKDTSDPDHLRARFNYDYY